MKGFALLAGLTLSTVGASSNSYTALFDAGGVSGYFQMSLADGQGLYTWDIDFSNFTTSCDLSVGMPCTDIKYHANLYILMDCLFRSYSQSLDRY